MYYAHHHWKEMIDKLFSKKIGDFFLKRGDLQQTSLESRPRQ
jgi:hypothetical protein